MSLSPRPGAVETLNVHLSTEVRCLTCPRKMSPPKMIFLAGENPWGGPSADKTDVGEADRRHPQGARGGRDFCYIVASWSARMSVGAEPSVWAVTKRSPTSALG